MTTPTHLIINSPFAEPAQHWYYVREERRFELRAGRRPAGYVVATQRATGCDDPGVFMEIALVNHIRTQVASWRERGYPGTTAITRRLLQHWQDPDERHSRRFFFCQLEAIETLIWLREAPEGQALQVPGDGGDFARLCCKMATGTGKTVVMAMTLAWQFLNKAASPQDPRFSSHALLMAPGLTVRSRLAVLQPSHPQNYYEVFNIVPAGLMDRLRLGKVCILNWHALQWDSAEKLAGRKSVDKRGAKSDRAYVKTVLGDLAQARNLLVLNDEAHHAWRGQSGMIKSEKEKSTVWIGGLDRIHRTLGILQCYDYSATPFVPTGKKNSDEQLFSWIVSDFGLNDAIEAGLVKTPRVVVRDDSKERLGEDLKSRLYHLYSDPEVKDDLNRNAEASEPLPQLVENAYALLGKDWLATKQAWEAAGHRVPPVMITVANTTDTSSRIKYAFDRGRISIPELCDPSRTLQIDSKVIEKAEATASEIALEDSADSVKLTQKQEAERLRQIVDTVGVEGEPGAFIQNVLSVGMLTEGWDAKTVTHIMGLRAFSSQLLCEQVIGRGLRRTSYEVDEATGLYKAEYVNIFGIPFSFMPHESDTDATPLPAKPKTRIAPVAAKQAYEICWPNVLRIEFIPTAELQFDLSRLPPLELNPMDVITHAELQAVIAGKPNVSAMAEIDLKEIADRFRFQTLAFRLAIDLFESEPNLRHKEQYLMQLIHIADTFVRSDKLQVQQGFFRNDVLRMRVLILLNLRKIMSHLKQHLRAVSAEQMVPILDKEVPFKSTSGAMVWYTSKPCESFEKTQLSHVVVDSDMEYQHARILDGHPQVRAFAKNDHLGFFVYYSYEGAVRKYVPDYLVQLEDGTHLILETKGQPSAQTRAKDAYLKEWIAALNRTAGMGKWRSLLCYDSLSLGHWLDNIPTVG
jgi:type III restriction enzyme